jgi:hypothetical protein
MMRNYIDLLTLVCMLLLAAILLSYLSYRATKQKAIIRSIRKSPSSWNGCSVFLLVMTSQSTGRYTVIFISESKEGAIEALNYKMLELTSPGTDVGVALDIYESILDQSFSDPFYIERVYHWPDGTVDTHIGPQYPLSFDEDF